MKFPRSSGILLHITSLPGGHGIGDLGPGASAFADFLKAAGQTLWQVLPIGPTGYGDSPYQSFSAFAGNPLLISLDRLVEKGLLEASEIGPVPEFPAGEVDYRLASDFKCARLHKAFETFQSGPQSRKEPLEKFRREHRGWLTDYALFAALKQQFGGVAWPQWDKDLVQRKPQALDSARREFSRKVAEQEFQQFLFHEQWTTLKRYCNEKNIRIMGDLPIYVAHDSSDVWAHQEMFHLDEHGAPAKVAGVPPDYFSATGQLWGNPIYRWDRMKSDEYAWWRERLSSSLRQFDLLRIDHFRGFEAYWEVPGGDKTAEHGQWTKGPGAEFFSVVKANLGDLPIVAENLGVITPEVEGIREQFHFPGMAVLQFAFGTDPQAPTFRPHNYPRDVVAYSGTHDNDTTLGWWTSQDAGGSTRSEEDIRKEREFARAYLNFDGEDVNWVFIRALMASVANMVVFPMQDVLGLGTAARMNLPGTTGGNWKWRMTEPVNDEAAQLLSSLAKLYDR
jgi:4-alpha-glucanotransferase